MCVVLLQITLITCQNGVGRQGNEVEDLTADSDFRSVKLQWRFWSDPAPQGFHITFCEISPWVRANENCFERHLLAGKRRALNGHDSLIADGRGLYEAVLFDLRMLTNYTVSVEPMTTKAIPLVLKKKHANRARLYSPEKVFVTTKGFTAHATNCLANSSDIVVHTGPHFGGKIAVEGSIEERCSLFGNRSSSQDTYTLRIKHSLCGSKTVNNSRIDTVVVVHESSNVVTHNSRRFLVQCSFIPETFTIKATFNIPEELEKKNNFNFKELEQALQNLDSNDVFTYEHYKQNHVKDSRILAEQAPAMQKNVGGYESQMIGLLIIVIALVIIVIIVIGLIVWWYVNNSRRRNRNPDIETVSTSGSSCMTFQGDGDALMRANTALQNDTHTLPKNMNPFLGAQVALVSLKPVRDLY